MKHTHETGSWRVVHRCKECDRVYSTWEAKDNRYVCPKCGSHPLEKLVGQKTTVYLVPDTRGEQFLAFFSLIKNAYEETNEWWSFRQLNNADLKKGYFDK